MALYDCIDQLLNAALAAARRAIGILKGLHDT